MDSGNVRPCNSALMLYCSRNVGGWIEKQTVPEQWTALKIDQLLEEEKTVMRNLNNSRKCSPSVVWEIRA